MAERIYDKKEFLERTGLDEARLEALLESQVFRAAGKVDGAKPYFTDESAELLEPILKLLEIGYTVEEVIRIRRKVGLPQKKGERLKNDAPALLTVGELANRVGANPRTIKHWEEKGIIEPDSYSPGGFRLYREVYVQLCLMIQDLQLFGYALEEIKEVADLFRDFLALGRDPSVFTPRQTLDKLGAMREKIALLNAKMDLFQKGIDRWRGLLKQKQKEIAALSGRLEKEERKISVVEKLKKVRKPALAKKREPEPEAT